MMHVQIMLQNVFRKVFFVDKFDWDVSKYQRFCSAIGSLWLQADYIVTKDFCNKIWSNLPTDGSSALKPEDIVLDKDGATILQFPNKNEDDNQDEDEDDKSNDLAEIYQIKDNSIASTVFTGIFTTKAFDMIYKALLGANAAQMEENLTNSDTAVCDYSVSYWQDCPAFIQGLFVNNYDNDRLSEFVYRISSFGSISTDAFIYPLTYKVSNSSSSFYKLGFAISSSGILKVNARKSVVGVWGGSEKEYYFKNGESTLFDMVPGIQTTINDIPYYISSLWNGRTLLYGTAPMIQGDNVIDVGTEENFKQFCEYVSTGKYTLAELLNLMERGWIIEINKGKKEWEGVKNRGKTAKETLEDPEKGKKYKTEKGNISLGSLADGVAQSTPAHGQPLYEFLGDPTEGTELEIIPSIDPSTGTAPEIGTDPAPGTGGQGVIIISPWTNVEVNDTWWGSDYAPTNDPNSGTAADPVPSTSPGNNSDNDSSNTENDKNPVTPGLNGSNSPDDSSNIQWYQRFPFSIPWDVYRVISFFSKPAVVPKWTVPFKIKRLGIEDL